MDKKRKSMFSSGRDSQGKRSRPQHNEPRTKPTEIMSNDKSLFTHFPRLSREIIDGLRRIEDGSTCVNSDIITAATELHRALSAASAPLLHTNVNASSLGTETISTTPALPHILDEKLERSVFTHPAMSNDIHGTYDRLEILGDAYLELIATKLIWDRCEGLSSGRISQIRELLVNNETLAGFASQYGLDKKASVPRDSQAQSKRWTKTKGDIFEAYVAAVILSDPINGYWKAENWLSRLWQPTLLGVEVQKPIVHAKEDLAKRIMGKDVKLKYVDERPSVQHGKGRQTFFIGVYLTGWGWDNLHLGSGQGPNKTIAGNEAALKALRNDALISKISGAKRASNLNGTHK